MCPTAKKSETESNMAKVHLNAAYVQESQMARHMFIGEVCQKALYFLKAHMGTNMAQVLLNGLVPSLGRPGLGFVVSP